MYWTFHHHYLIPLKFQNHLVITINKNKLRNLNYTSLLVFNKIFYALISR